jgi:hypothetical protein
MVPPERTSCVEILTDVDVTLHDGLEGAVANARGLLVNAERLEEDLGGARTFVSDGNDIAVSSSYELSISTEEASAVFISWSKSRAR